jgi:hypothetical protein
MKDLFFRFLCNNPFGEWDSSSFKNDEVENYNRKLVQANKSGSDVDTQLELQKIMFINTADNMIIHPNWKARDITVVTAIRAAIITDLDAGIETFYNPLGYKLQYPSSNYLSR